MEAWQRIDRLIDWLDEAKAVPFSTSVMLNRDAFAEELEALRDELPTELQQARILLGERDEVLARAHREAERIAADAHADHERLVADHEVVRSAERRAEEILAAARAQAGQLRVEADDYIDSKLASFEIILHKTLRTIERGRTQLADRMQRPDVPADPSAAGAPGAVPGDPDREPPDGGTDRPPLYDHEAL